MLLDVAPEPVPLTADSEGVVRVGTSRVSLASVMAAFRSGTTAEEIAQQYPSVELAEVYAVIAYYLRHRAEVDTYLRFQESREDEARAENEDRFDPSGVRARLLARRAV